MRPAKPRHKPWIPPAYELADATAIRALRDGTATPDQQKRAVAYIVNTLAGTYDLSYRPTSDRDTAFAEGRRFVGLQVVKLMNLNLALIKQKLEQPGD
jgi:hypothetical protein